MKMADPLSPLNEQGTNIQYLVTSSQIVVQHLTNDFMLQLENTSNPMVWIFHTLFFNVGSVDHLPIMFLLISLLVFGKCQLRRNHSAETFIT